MKQYAIIGLGKFGASLATTLNDMGEEVLGIDSDLERVNELSDKLTHIIQADATDENVLKSLGIRNFDIVVISMGADLEATSIITMQCKELGVKTVWAKVYNELHGRILLKVGADKIIIPERDMGVRVARSLSSSSLLEYVELSENYSLLEIKAIPIWYDKTLEELNFRSKYGANIMAIKNSEGEFNVSPLARDVITEGDVLVVIGHKDSLKKMGKL